VVFDLGLWRSFVGILQIFCYLSALLMEEEEESKVEMCDWIALVLV